jgi:hypothetical protein
LIGPMGHQGAWLVVLVGYPFQAAVGQLTGFTQQAVQRGLTGHILALVGQAWYNLAGGRSLKASLLSSARVSRRSASLSWSVPSFSVAVRAAGLRVYFAARAGPLWLRVSRAQPSCKGLHARP